MPHDQCITCEDIGLVAVLGSLQEQRLCLVLSIEIDFGFRSIALPDYGSSLLDLLIWIRNVASCAIHCSVFCIVIYGSDKLN